MKTNIKSIIGKFVFYVAEFLGVGSVLTLMCMADCEDPAGIPFAIMLGCVAIVSLLTALFLDDPNRFLRHIVSIYVVAVASIGLIIFPKNKTVRIVRKKLNKVGGYRRLYSYSLRSWDILKYDEPTSRYFWGSDGPAYDRYYLKEAHDRIENKKKDRIKEFNVDLRRYYRVTK